MIGSGIFPLDFSDASEGSEGEVSFSTACRSSDPLRKEREKAGGEEGWL
jgi:hypothetical protein